MVRYSRLWEVVGSDFLRSISWTDLRASLEIYFLLMFQRLLHHNLFFHNLQKPIEPSQLDLRFYLYRFIFIRSLVSAVLDKGTNAGRNVRDS